MRIESGRLAMVLARNCKTLSELRANGLSSHTLTKVSRGEEVRPVTVGKIAKALGVDPADIIEKED